jgi:omega-hydroxy-beta-dihydromenaquinone-9 sulfotransferase
VTMRRVYDELGLELSMPVADAIDSAGSQAHESTHRYCLEEFGLDPDEIHTHLADLFERFQWDTRGEDARVN